MPPAERAQSRRVGARTLGDGALASPAVSAERTAAAVERLDELTRRLRVECPWDREQDERSIVPHTLEEAYELADAANRGDDAKLLDELGDVLFQVHFLSLLLEERGAGSMADVAEHCRQKLVHRHPHVFGDVEVAGAGEVLRNWDQIKQGEAGREPGIFGEVPENLPGPLYARKVQRRASSSGLDVEEMPYDAIEAIVQALIASETREDRFRLVGDLLFASVNVARRLKVDPELALRDSSDRFRARVLAAEQKARDAGREWSSLTDEERLDLYALAALEEATGR
jgi:MazG family protein